MTIWKKCKSSLVIPLSFKCLGLIEKFDNTDKLENNIVKFLKHLVLTKEMSQDIFEFVKPVGSIRPRIYGLPKIHKNDVPLRPILSMINSPQHKIAKFLNYLLEPVLDYYSNYVIKDSFTFVEKIRKIKTKNTFMASFDVKSLFTNVPLKEVIDICSQKLYELKKPHLSKENFVKLLKIATSDVRFSFNNIMYLQHDGVAMGSPLGPTLANIYMGFLESKIIPSFQDNIQYHRYVDDCFVIAENEQKLDNFYKLLNEQHDSIKFTIEKEQNNELSYLDVLVIRKSEFVTTVFRKDTFTGKYLNFQSHCSLKRKINLIKTLCHRAHLICSPEFFEREIEYIKTLLYKNGYPSELVSRTIKTHLNSLKRDKEFGPEKCVVTLKVPYINDRSVHFEKSIKQLLGTTFFAAKPRVIFTTRPLLVPEGKDLIPKFDKSMVIYQFDCYCDNSYIGLTTRQLKKRVKEHIPVCVEKFLNKSEKEKDNKSAKVLNAIKRSAITEHLVLNHICAQNFNLERFKIIKTCYNVYDLIKMEAICILNRKPTLCRQKEFDYNVVLFT